jgi:nucleotide-binding universal stress UspA family protein
VTVLGSVPAEIVRNAACVVLVVQTSALHEEV